MFQNLLLHPSSGRERSDIGRRARLSGAGAERPLLHPVQREFNLDDVERIEIETSYGVISPLVRHAPRNGHEGKFSMEYSIAAAVADRGIGISTYADDAAVRPELAAYFDRIVAREATDAMMPRWASIGVRFADGEVAIRHIEELKGSPRSPLQTSEVETAVLYFRLLLGIGLRDLPYELGPGHVHGGVDRRSLGPRVVPEDLYHQRGVVGEDHAGL